MSFTSGVFTLAAGNPVVTGTTISSTWANNTLTDIATGLSTCVLKDGTQTITANIPMSSFKLTGLAAGSVTGNSIRYEQLFNASGITLLGGLTLAGALNETHGADIASAGTIDLTAATGNVVDVTGTTSVTAITLSDGYQRWVRFTGALTLTNGASLVLPGGTNITTAAGDYALFIGYAAGVVRCAAFLPKSAVVGKQPTRQTFTSGSGTYTTPAGATRIYVRMVGGGGGSAGSGSGSPGSGGNGGSTTFSTLTAAGGSLGAGGGGATGGAGGAGTNGDINITGGTGGGGGAATSVYPATGGSGGSTPFGCTAAPAGTGNNGIAGIANTGAGASGASSGNQAAAFAGLGGGGGGYVEKTLTSPSATYSYGVGAGGTAGSAGTSGQTGAVGGSGLIIVDEFYN